MTTRNVDDTIHAFLQHTRDELPERSYAAVRNQIEHTPQRIVLGPWRTPFVNNITSYLLGAASVAVVVLAAVIGLNFISKPSTPAHSPSPAPSIAPTPTPVALDVTDRRTALEAGTYSASIPARATYTFTVPDGWTFDDIGSGRIFLYRTEGSSERWVSTLLINSIKGVFPDPCHGEAGPADVGQSVPEIVAALTSQAGLKASVPQPAQLVGANGMTFTVESQIDSSGCNGDGSLHQWRSASDFDEDFRGSRERLWVIDTGTGNPLVIQVDAFDWTSSDQQPSAEQVVASLRIE